MNKLIFPLALLLSVFTVACDSNEVPDDVEVVNGDVVISDDNRYESPVTDMDDDIVETNDVISDRATEPNDRRVDADSRYSGLMPDEIRYRQSENANWGSVPVSELDGFDYPRDNDYMINE